MVGMSNGLADQPVVTSELVTYAARLVRVVGRQASGDSPAALRLLSLVPIVLPAGVDTGLVNHTSPVAADLALEAERRALPGGDEANHDVPIEVACRRSQPTFRAAVAAGLVKRWLLSSAGP